MRCRKENSDFRKEVPNLVDVTEISAVIEAAGVLIGVVYYILDMQHQRQ
jgi:hypothetical protein